ncbi:DUF397 domain-containing protein [Micromonospora endolithica]|uniref:DUF397 domain-containing protein n=1 Tax=Micromonospora endolithica TaxID=230091 RepID=A0A3A9ZM55_9ACTN|nr:DUF397 domain-containing protein [Micromonospora endolithica]RKN49368.1 DUF397 domain-containing protein [Micromonospora endolithica]TWJ23557.1 uncharacterized protein DUF397 [Micromonospora endolithica]
MTTTTDAALARAGWHKSSHSGDEGACVEVARAPETVGVRDSKDPAGPVLLFPPAVWAAFAAAPPRS